MRTAFICVTVTVTSPLERIYISAGVTRRPFGFQPKGWCFEEVGTDRSTFAVISLWGKFGGLHACAATFSYILPPPNIFLTRLFSKLRLKRKDFQEILRLPWAQGVTGSNPVAPTNTRTKFKREIGGLRFAQDFGSRLRTPRKRLKFKSCPAMIFFRDETTVEVPRFAQDFACGLSC